MFNVARTHRVAVARASRCTIASDDGSSQMRNSVLHILSFITSASASSGSGSLTTGCGTAAHTMYLSCPCSFLHPPIPSPGQETRADTGEKSYSLAVGLPGRVCKTISKVWLKFVRATPNTNYFTRRRLWNPERCCDAVQIAWCTLAVGWVGLGGGWVESSNISIGVECAGGLNYKVWHWIY